MSTITCTWEGCQEKLDVGEWYLDDMEWRFLAHCPKHAKMSSWEEQQGAREMQNLGPDTDRRKTAARKNTAQKKKRRQ